MKTSTLLTSGLIAGTFAATTAMANISSTLEAKQALVSDGNVLTSKTFVSSLPSESLAPAPLEASSSSALIKQGNVLTSKTFIKSLPSQELQQVAMNRYGSTTDALVTDQNILSSKYLVKTAAGYQSSKATEKQQMDIVDTAIAAGKFQTLVVAVQEAGLVETLKGDGPFTVFAPTDAAFAKIPQDQLQAILADKEKLTQILTYHVVPGRVMAADVMNLASAETVQGQSIEINTSNGVQVDGANVIAVDIQTSNGVIHAIDNVILPE